MHKHIHLYLFVCIYSVYMYNYICIYSFIIIICKYDIVVFNCFALKHVLAICKLK